MTAGAYDLSDFAINKRMAFARPFKRTIYPDFTKIVDDDGADPDDFFQGADFSNGIGG